MALITITPQEVRTALSRRGYFVQEGHVPVPDIHVPTEEEIPPDEHVPTPDVHIPTEEEIPPDEHVPTPDIHIPLDEHVPTPDIHIPIPVAPEVSPYAKYLKFLPFLVLLVSEKHVLDLRRVL